MCMEKVSLQPGFVAAHRRCPVVPIDRVPDDGMPNEGKVHSDLMGSPGLDLDIDEARGRQAFTRGEVGDSRLALAMSCHPLALERIAADRGIDRRLVVF